MIMYGLEIVHQKTCQMKTVAVEARDIHMKKTESAIITVKDFWH